MKKLALLLALAGVTTLFASNNQSETHKKVMKIGAESSKNLFKALEPELKKRIKKDGFVKAGEFCADEAQKITLEVNKKLDKGVSVKRVSLKNRNKLNAPTPSEEGILKAFDLLKSSNVMLKPLVQEEASSYKFYKPLMINKGVCLKCHGDENTMDRDAKELFSKKYPNDKATGYKMNDVRGAIVVEINKELVK